MRTAPLAIVLPRIVTKLTLLGALLHSSPGLACRSVYCAQRLAPAAEQVLPANAQCVVAAGKAGESFDPELGEPVEWRPWIRRVNEDGGVSLLMEAPPELQPSGFFGEATLFLLGPTAPGERFRLESSGDCDRSRAPVSEIKVVEAAPIPERLGTPVSPPSFRTEASDGYSCNPSDPWATRDLFLEIDESVRPWLSVARVNLMVNGVTSSTDYGGLARGFDGGTRVFVTRLQRICTVRGTAQESTTVQTWPVWMELDIPGSRERRPFVEFSVEMDCRPSCASVGGLPLVVGLVLFFRRRRPA